MPDAAGNGQHSRHRGKKESKGDRVKIKGCRVKIDGKDVFMASKIKRSNYFEFKVRFTGNGQPFWTMTPEEVVREISPVSK
jgi:hypothetical protein